MILVCPGRGGWGGYKTIWGTTTGRVDQPDYNSGNAGAGIIGCLFKKNVNSCTIHLQCHEKLYGGSLNNPIRFTGIKY